VINSADAEVRADAAGLQHELPGASELLEASELQAQQLPRQADLERAEQPALQRVIRLMAPTRSRISPRTGALRSSASISRRVNGPWKKPRFRRAAICSSG